MLNKNREILKKCSRCLNASRKTIENCLENMKKLEDNYYNSVNQMQKDYMDIHKLFVKQPIYPTNNINDLRYKTQMAQSLCINVPECTENELIRERNVEFWLMIEDINKVLQK